MHECEVHGRADLVCLNDDDRAVLKDAAEWLEAFARKYAMRGFHGASQEDFGKIVGRLQGLAGRVPADAEEARRSLGRAAGFFSGTLFRRVRFERLLRQGADRL